MTTGDDPLEYVARMLDVDIESLISAAADDCQDCCIGQADYDYDCEWMVCERHGPGRDTIGPEQRPMRPGERRDALCPADCPDRRSDHHHVMDVSGRRWVRFGRPEAQL